MPKVIDNIRGRAVEEAREELLLYGYEALTMRRIAKKLGIGLGTIYNYFPSKEYLAACVMLEDWQALTAEFESEIQGKTPEEVIAGLFDMIGAFARRFIPAWEEYQSHGSTRGTISRYHPQLVEQLSGYIRQTLSARRQEDEPWLADFLAEFVLRFASAPGSSYAAIEPAVHKLLANGTAQ